MEPNLYKRLDKLSLNDGAFEKLQQILLAKQAAYQKAQTPFQFQAALLEQLGNAVIASDINNKIVYWNSYAQSLYQWQAEEVIGKNLLDVIIAPTSRLLAATILLNLAELNRWRGELILQRKDKSQFLAEVTKAVIRDANGNITGWVGIFVERYEQQTSMCQHQRVDKMGDQNQLPAWREQALNRFMIAIHRTLELKTILTNAVEEIREIFQVDRVRIHHYLPSQRVWLNVATAIQFSNFAEPLLKEVPDVENEITRQLKSLQVVRVDDTSNLEEAVFRKLVQAFPGAWLFAPLHFQGHLWGSLSLVIDNRAYHWQETEVELLSALAEQLVIAIQQAQIYQQALSQNRELQYQVEQRTAQLQQKIQQLEQLNILKNDFLSTVSHELRTPLANMKMAIQMLKLTSQGERHERYLEILQSECNRETELVSDLLDLQRLAAGVYPNSLKEALYLQDWLPKMIEPFVYRAQERQQSLRLEIPAEIPPIISTRTGLERIMVELLNNACKYTQAGGEIVLRVHYTDLPAQQVLSKNTVDSNPSIFTFVLSNQAEIPKPELSHIFDKFYRIPGVDPWKQGGTGLGLALVQQLVEYMGGVIEVESNNGWTTFTIQLPAH